MWDTWIYKNFEKNMEIIYYENPLNPLIFNLLRRRSWDAKTLSSDGKPQKRRLSFSIFFSILIASFRFASL